MNFWYSLVDPDKEYMHGRYDHVKKISDHCTDDDIDDVISEMMNKHGVDEMWYAIEKQGKYTSSGVTCICRPSVSVLDLIEDIT